MRIPRIDTVTVHVVANGGAKHWIFVRVVTETGTTGWGECYTVSGREHATASIARVLGEQLVGRPLEHIRQFTRSAYLDVGLKRGSLELHAAISGVELALWDALGKTLDVPAQNLLGGPHRASVRLYANGWSSNSHFGEETVDETVANAVAMVDRGFSALKLDPFSGPWRPHPCRKALRDAVDLVAVIRDAVGADVDLLIEGHRRLDGSSATEFAALLEPLQPFWLEEPTDPADVDGLREVRAATSIPIVAGESLYSAPEFLPLLKPRAVDVLNPDVAACGGLTGLLDIALMADAHGLVVAPHNYNSTTVALAATVAAGVVMPNLLITEYFVNFEEPGREVGRGGVRVVEGRACPADAPGLGIELDLVELEARAAQEPSPRRLADIEP